MDRANPLQPNAYLQALHLFARTTVAVQAALDEEDWDRVLALLEERQEQMRRIDRLAIARSQLTAAQRAEAGSMLAQVAAKDKEAAEHISGKLAATREEITLSDQAHATLTAYRRSTGRTTAAHRACFLDKQR